MTSSPTSVVLIGGAILVVLSSILGLILLAALNPASLPVVIPILSGIVGSFATAAAAIITHIVGANFELRRSNNVHE